MEIIMIEERRNKGLPLPLKAKRGSWHRSVSTVHTFPPSNLVPRGETNRAHRLEGSGSPACCTMGSLRICHLQVGNPRRLVGSLVPVQTQGPRPMGASSLHPGFIHRQGTPTGQSRRRWTSITGRGDPPFLDTLVFSRLLVGG